MTIDTLGKGKESVFSNGVSLGISTPCPRVVGQHKTNSVLFDLFWLFVCLFVLLFVCFDFHLFGLILEREREHEIGWIESWRGSRKSWGRENMIEAY